MKQKFKPHENSKRTVFISFNEGQINNLNTYLTHSKFDSSITTFKPASRLEQRVFSEFEPKIPYYYIIVPAQEQYDAFEVGKVYAVENNLYDIICCYPNLDFDTVKNIKEREFGLNK